MSFIEGDSRDQISLLPACVDDYVCQTPSSVSSMPSSPAWTGRAGLQPGRRGGDRPGFQPGDMLRLYI